VPKSDISAFFDEFITLRQLRLGGMADALTPRVQQARADSLAPLDFLGLLLRDEMERRSDRLIERRIKDADFRDRKTLDTFNWGFNKIDRTLIFELATTRFIERREDVLMLGNAGVGKSHLAQALGMAAVHAGFRVLYREAHRLFEDTVLIVKPSRLNYRSVPRYARIGPYSTRSMIASPSVREIRLPHATLYAGSKGFPDLRTP